MSRENLIGSLSTRSLLPLQWVVQRSSEVGAYIEILDRTTVISCLRLRELHKRFGASAEDRYEFAIQAVICSVVEANLAIICACLLKLGYRLFAEWLKRNIWGGVYAEGLRRLTLGNGPDPVYSVGGFVALDDIADHHHPFQDRYIKSPDVSIRLDV